MSWQETINLLLRDFDGRCAYCGTPFEGEFRPNINHVVPLRHGGTRAAENLKLACGPCNTSKHGGDLEAWRALMERKLAGIPSFSRQQADWLAAQGFRFPPPPPWRFYFEDPARGGWRWVAARAPTGARCALPRNADGRP